MKTTPRKLLTIASLLIFSIMQVGVQVGLAEPNSSAAVVPTLQQQLLGRLTTKSNKPILINGVSGATGASIVSGTTLETRADESATVDIGPLGRVEISPNTKVVLTFDEKGDIRALILSGCVVLTANRNTRGELANESGTISTTERETGGVLRNCPERVGGGEGEGGLFGIGVAATVAVLTAGGLVALTPLFFQNNPSP